MSLLLIQTGNPALNYLPCPDPPSPAAIFNLRFCNPPRLYQESVSRIEGFYYDQGRDVYVLIALMDQVFWPSWKYTRFDFDPETGVEVSRQDGGVGGAIDFSWTRGYQASDWKSVYAQRIFNPNNAIVKVRGKSPIPTSFQLGSPLVVASDVDNKSMTYFTLNREQKIIAFNTGANDVLERYNYDTGTNLGGMRLPERRAVDFTTESDELVWVLMQDSSGVGFSLCKVNFIKKDFQLYSKINTATPGVDNSVAIAFDKLRKSVAIFRRRSDAVDGSAQHVLDIYKPIVSPEILTEPVPVTPLDPDGRTTFVAHLVDTKGTGGGSKTVKVRNTNPNGKLKQPTTSVRGNGSITIPYDTPGRLETDTITIEANV